jgi:hypothetical protein
MPETFQTKLAVALERARAIARKHVVKSTLLQRADRELLTERSAPPEEKSISMLLRPHQHNTTFSPSPSSSAKK